MPATRLVIVLSFLALLLASACESETGILIRTSASASFSAEISGLRFYVGKNEIDARLYYTDREPLGDVSLSGRDIAADPYRLLLTPRGTPADEDAFVVVVLALGVDGQPMGLGRLATPVVFSSGKVLQWDLEIVAIGGEVTVTDTGCLKYLDAGLGEYVHIGVGDDADCDGFFSDEGDCNDLNPAQSPGSAEDCSNGVDDNCNDLVDDADTADFDSDGYSSCGADGERDCNDNDGDISPAAAEICDGLDNNCSGSCDDGFDVDGDQVSTCGSMVVEGQCVAEGEPDCDDENAARYPSNPEICDGVDNDCVGGCDDDVALDPDGDRYTDCGSRIGECGVATVLTDCEPGNAEVHPGAAELCDGIDSDCDGIEVSLTPCFNRPELLGCFEGVRQCAADGTLGETCVSGSDDSAELPAEFCATYGACETNMTAADPFACILDAGNQEPVDEMCLVAMVNEATCPGSSVQVVPVQGISADAQCTFAIIGGQTQQGYNLTLASDGTNGQVVTGCQTSLIVEALPGAGESTISILFDDGLGTTQVFRVLLKANRLASCTNAGLTCSTWVPLQ